MEIYPLKFDPIFKERIWGGNKLQQVLGKKTRGNSVGESWEVSGVPGDDSVICNGIYAGRTLSSLIAEFPEDILGREGLRRFGRDFPILIKFIDAKEDLSIQLHPNDALARKRHDAPGKTEMWYILDAEPGAKLIVGFEGEVKREVYQDALQSGTITDLLHHREVHPGEAYFIEAGTIHAIGGGVLLAEIQQSSDVTYRVYDYERIDDDGKQRELHTDLALDALDFKPNKSFFLDYAKSPNQMNTVAECPYFTTHYLKLNGSLERDLESRATFRILICVSGQAEVRTGAWTESIRQGETLLIPAASEDLRLTSTSCELLEVSL